MKLTFELAFGSTPPWNPSLDRTDRKHEFTSSTCCKYFGTADRTTRMASDNSGGVDGHAPEIQGRLLLLSNRLPITIKRSDDGSYTFSMSSGGLVTGLSGLSKTTSFQWYGWPGLEVPDNEVDGMKQRLKDEYGAHPVFIDDELADRHYNGFASTSSLPAATCRTMWSS